MLARHREIRQEERTRKTTKTLPHCALWSGSHALLAAWKTREALMRSRRDAISFVGLTQAGDPLLLFWETSTPTTEIPKIYEGELVDTPLVMVFATIVRNDL